MITATAAILLAFGPKQATPSEVAAFIAETQKISAMVVMPNYQKITYEDTAKTLDELLLNLKKDGFSGSQSSAALLFQTGLPKSKLGVLRGLVESPAANAQPKASGQVVNVPRTAVANNMISFQTKAGEVVSIGGLVGLPFTRNLEISPYFSGDGANEFPLALNVKDLEGLEFAKLLGRGIGAKVTVDAKRVMLGFDAATFRTQFTKVLALAREGVNKDRKPDMGFNRGFQEFDPDGQFNDGRGHGPANSQTKEGLNAALNVLNATIGQMTDTTLEQTFAYANTDMALDMLRYPAIQQAIVAYFRSLPADTPQSGGTVVRGGRPSVGAVILNRVDPRNPGKVHISTDFRVRIELNIASQNNPNTSSIVVQIL